MRDRLRLLVLTPDFPPARGGIQTLVHRVVRHAVGIEAHVITLAHPDAAAFDADERCYTTRVRGPTELRPFHTALLNARAVAEARRVKPDLILSAHIVTSPAAAMIKRLLGIPVVQYVYAKEMGARPGLARFAVARSDRTIAISQYATDLVARVGGPRERVTMVTPGVDLPSAPVQREPAERPTLLTIARLEDRYKGHDVLLRALPLVRAKVPGVQWVIVGDGPLREGLEHTAAALGIDADVHFQGALSDADRDAWLRSAHVFAMPSRLPAGGFAGEGFGIVYLEAGAHGMPVVAGNVAGALDAVVHGETGLFVDPADHVAVADSVTTLLSDQDLAARLGDQGQRHAEGFAWPRIAEKVEAVLHETATS